MFGRGNTCNSFCPLRIEAALGNDVSREWCMAERIRHRNKRAVHCDGFRKVALSFERRRNGHLLQRARRGELDEFLSGEEEQLILPSRKLSGNLRAPKGIPCHVIAIERARDTIPVGKELVRVQIFVPQVIVECPMESRRPGLGNCVDDRPGTATILGLLITQQNCHFSHRVHTDRSKRGVGAGRIVPHHPVDGLSRQSAADSVDGVRCALLL